MQARIWHEATKARINHVDPQEYGSNKGFIAIATEDDIVPKVLLTVCGCKLSNCAKRSCKNAASLARICVIAAMNFVKDPKEILKDDSSEDDIKDEEEENNE